MRQVRSRHRGPRQPRRGTCGCPSPRPKRGGRVGIQVQESVPLQCGPCRSDRGSRPQHRLRSTREQTQPLRADGAAKHQAAPGRRGCDHLRDRPVVRRRDGFRDRHRQPGSDDPLGQHGPLQLRGPGRRARQQDRQLADRRRRHLELRPRRRGGDAPGPADRGRPDLEEELRRPASKPRTCSGRSISSRPRRRSPTRCRCRRSTCSSGSRTAIPRVAPTSARSTSPSMAPTVGIWHEPIVRPFTPN